MLVAGGQHIMRRLVAGVHERDCVARPDQPGGPVTTSPIASEPGGGRGARRWAGGGDRQKLASGRDRGSGRGHRSNNLQPRPPLPPVSFGGIAAPGVLVTRAGRVPAVVRRSDIPLSAGEIGELPSAARAGMSTGVVRRVSSCRLRLPWYYDHQLTTEPSVTSPDHPPQQASRAP